MANRRNAALAVVLTWIAGFVDAVGVIALAGVFTANMSGNTIDVGRGVAAGYLALAVRHGFAIPVFVAGMVASRLLSRALARRGSASIAAPLLLLEALLLLVLARIGAGMSRIPSAPLPRYYLMVALPSLAMGLQNATLSRFGALTIRTTHISGTLAQLADEAAAYLIWFRRHTRGRSWSRICLVTRVSPRQRPFREAALLAGTWAGYLAGAMAGAHLLARWRLDALLLPAALLGILVAVDFARPFRGRGAGLSRSTVTLPAGPSRT